MRTHCRQGRWPWTLAGIAAGGIAAAILLAMSAGASTPEWKRRLDANVPHFVQPAAGIVSPSACAAQSRILNDLLRRPSWDEPEARELCDVIRAGYPRPLSERRSLSTNDFGAAMVHGSASLAMLARMEVGAPISPGAKRIIVETLTDELSAGFAERRCNAAMVLIVTRAIEDPLVRAEVERLAEDPDRDTAEIVAMQLAHYDDQRSRALTLARSDEE